MTSQTKFHLIFNTLGALIGLSIVGYILYSLVHTETEAACRARYPAATRLSLNMSDGKPMTPMQLQARAGVDEYGVNGNTKVITDAPGGVAVEVALAPVADVESAGEKPANGIFFKWTPAGIGSATAACLSYMLWLPDDFDFADGGLLPGIFGDAKGGEPDAAEVADAEAPQRLGARPVWWIKGETTLQAATAGAGYKPVQKGFTLPKGRWVEIEQELVLNTAGKADGVARLWLDGDLKADSGGLMLLGKDQSGAIRGVLADIGYAKVPGKPGALRITPFELAWK
jgi:Polysaccharide lyase 14